MIRPSGLADGIAHRSIKTYGFTSDSASPARMSIFVHVCLIHTMCEHKANAAYKQSQGPESSLERR